MKFSFKKGMFSLMLAVVMSVVMIAGSAAAATTQNYQIVKAANPSEASAADGFAVKPASVSDDGLTVTLGFNTSFLYSIGDLSISYDGGATYSTFSGSTSGGVKSFSFPAPSFSSNTFAKISVSVFGLYNETYDIQIKWL